MTLDKNALAASAERIALVALIAERDGSEFDGEIHLTSEEGERIVAALAALPTTSVSEPVSDLVKRLREAAVEVGKSGNILAATDLVAAASALTAAEAKIAELEQRSLAEGWNYDMDEAPRDGRTLILALRGVKPTDGPAFVGKWDAGRGLWNIYPDGMWSSVDAWRPLPNLPQPPEAK